MENFESSPINGDNSSDEVEKVVTTTKKMKRNYQEREMIRLMRRACSTKDENAADTKEKSGQVEFFSDSHLSSFTSAVETMDVQRLSQIRKIEQEQLQVLTVPLVKLVVPNVISDDRMILFKSKFQQLFEFEREECLQVEKVEKHLSSVTSGSFTKSEISSGLHRLEAEGKIMLTEGFVFLI